MKAVLRDEPTMNPIPSLSVVPWSTFMLDDRGSGDMNPWWTLVYPLSFILYPWFWFILRLPLRGDWTPMVDLRHPLVPWLGLSFTLGPSLPLGGRGGRDRSGPSNFPSTYTFCLVMIYNATYFALTEISGGDFI